MLLLLPQAVLRDPELRSGRDLCFYMGAVTQWNGLVAQKCRGTLLVEHQARCCGAPDGLCLLDDRPASSGTGDPWIEMHLGVVRHRCLDT